MSGTTKIDEFSEKFQTAFDPPSLIFGNIYCKVWNQLWDWNVQLEKVKIVGEVWMNALSTKALK